MRVRGVWVVLGSDADECTQYIQYVWLPQIGGGWYVPQENRSLQPLAPTGPYYRLWKATFGDVDLQVPVDVKQMWDIWYNLTRKRDGRDDVREVPWDFSHDDWFKELRRFNKCAAQKDPEFPIKMDISAAMATNYFLVLGAVDQDTEIQEASSQVSHCPTAHRAIQPSDETAQSEETRQERQEKLMRALDEAVTQDMIKEVDEKIRDVKDRIQQTKGSISIAEELYYERRGELEDDEGSTALQNVYRSHREQQEEELLAFETVLYHLQKTQKLHRPAVETPQEMKASEKPSFVSCLEEISDTNSTAEEGTSGEDSYDTDITNEDESALEKPIPQLLYTDRDTGKQLDNEAAAWAAGLDDLRAATERNRQAFAHFWAFFDSSEQEVREDDVTDEYDWSVEMPSPSLPYTGGYRRIQSSGAVAAEQAKPRQVLEQFKEETKATRANTRLIGVVEVDHASPQGSADPHDNRDAGHDSSSGIHKNGGDSKSEGQIGLGVHDGEKRAAVAVDDGSEPDDLEFQECSEAHEFETNNKGSAEPEDRNGGSGSGVLKYVKGIQPASKVNHILKWSTFAGRLYGRMKAGVEQGSLVTKLKHISDITVPILGVIVAVIMVKAYF